MWKNVTPNLRFTIMVSRFTSPKVSSGTAIILRESNVVGDQIVSESCGGSGIVPIYSDYDNVGLGAGKDCALEGLSGSSVGVATALSTVSLLAICVLVNFNQCLIFENRFRGWRHGCHVLSEDKRGLRNSPKSELRFFFFDGQQSSTSEKLTRAVVVAWPLSDGRLHILEETMSHLSPSIAWLVARTDRNTCCPGISNIRSPCGNLLVTPVVNIEVNETISSTSAGVESLSERGVP